MKKYQDTLNYKRVYVILLFSVVTQLIEMLNLNKFTELNNNKLKLVKACLGQNVASYICFNFHFTPSFEKYVTKKVL